MARRGQHPGMFPAATHLPGRRPPGYSTKLLLPSQMLTDRTHAESLAPHGTGQRLWEGSGHYLRHAMAEDKWVADPAKECNQTTECDHNIRGAAGRETVRTAPAHAGSRKKR